MRVLKLFLINAKFRIDEILNNVYVYGKCQKNIKEIIYIDYKSMCCACYLFIEFRKKFLWKISIGSFSFFFIISHLYC